MMDDWEEKAGKGSIVLSWPYTSVEEMTDPIYTYSSTDTEFRWKKVL
jgi:hypothetical protein